MASARLVVEPSPLSVDPDSMTVGQLRVRNDGDEPARFDFDAVGDAQAWVSVAPASLQLAPGEEATARIFLRPPRLPSVRAGRHAVVIRARIDGDRSQEVTATAEVDVAPYADVSVALDSPQPSSANPTSGRLTIDNRGNDILRATIAGGDNDRGDGVGVVADPASVEVEPGGSTAVTVNARPPRRLFGPPQDLPFTVVVTPEGSAPVTARGTVHQVSAISRRAVIVIAGVVVVALVSVLLSGVFSSSSSSSSSSSKPSSGGTTAAATTTNCPGAGHLAHDANGQIRHTTVEPDNYSFLFLKPGGCLPIRWNPCEPIHYVINAGSATPDEIATTQQAAMQASQATGIEFVYDGLTTESPRNRRTPYQPTLYPNRWAPVLIAWDHLGGTDSLTEAAGGGIPSQVGDVDVSGVVFLNLDAHLANNAPLPSGFGSGVTWGRILLHELGHVLGLGHVNGIEEIMHDPVTEQTSPTSAYGLGDLTGLRLLGKSAGCLTTPTPAPVPPPTAPPTT